jgi:DNA-binding SARP family transcriptional activator
LSVRRGTAWVPVRASQQRLVLSILLIEAGRVVTIDRLVDEIWGERPPRSASSVVRGYVMRLRRTLGGGVPGPLVTRASGYELAVGEEDVDAEVFHRLADSGRRALAGGDPGAAALCLSQAQTLWRGPVLADVPPARTVRWYAIGLEEDRLATIEHWVRAQLELSRHAELVGPLRRLVEAHPLREGLWADLMVALYRSERRGDALQAYQQARRALATDLGLEPGAQLQDLQRAILSDDPRLGGWSSHAMADARPRPAFDALAGHIPLG